MDLFKKLSKTLNTVEVPPQLYWHTMIVGIDIDEEAAQELINRKWGIMDADFWFILRLEKLAYIYVNNIESIKNSGINLKEIQQTINSIIEQGGYTDAQKKFIVFILKTLENK